MASDEYSLDIGELTLTELEGFVTVLRTATTERRSKLAKNPPTNPLERAAKRAELVGMLEREVLLQTALVDRYIDTAAVVAKKPPGRWEIPNIGTHPATADPSVW